MFHKGPCTFTACVQHSGEGCMESCGQARCYSSSRGQHRLRVRFRSGRSSPSGTEGGRGMAGMEEGEEPVGV